MVLAACAFVCGAPLASAQTPQPTRSEPDAAGEITGTVLGLDGGDLIVDLGADRGAAAGSVVELWRPLKLKHPVTGKVFVDRFRIGSIELSQVRPSLSLARPSGELTRPPERGDIVILPARTRPAAAASAPLATAPSSGEMSEEEAEAQAIGAMLDALRGANIATRIRRYEDYVREKPNGRFARVLYEEAASLRLLYEKGSKGAASKEPARPQAPALRSFQSPRAAIAESPLRIALELTDAATGALLHTRNPGEPSYVTTPMTSIGEGYWVAAIPAERMVAPGIEIFVEATSDDGAAVAVLGLPESPRSIEIRPKPRPAPPDDVAAEVAIATDYADYNRFRGNDRVWQTEGHFGLRFDDTGIRALRSGFGVYRGVGGTIEELDVKGLPGRKIGLTYGYIETEIGATPDFSIIARLAVGLLDDGVSGGAQALARIGSDRGTNLVLGGELLGGVGMRSIAELNLNSFERFPIVLRTEVSNQPAGASTSGDQLDTGVAEGQSEIGARGIVQVGMRVTQPLTISLRGSFQGRNIEHAGPGFGAGVSYEW